MFEWLKDELFPILCAELFILYKNLKYHFIEQNNQFNNPSINKYRILSTIMFERLKDELFPILCAELIILFICAATNSRGISKIQNVFICVIAYCAYTYSFLVWFSMFIITILIGVVFVLLVDLYFNKVRSLKWSGCYSGKYIDLVKDDKIMDGCTVCALTFDEFGPTTQAVALKCKHAFTDDELIHKWLNLHHSCPSCRSKV
jgi:hypothetical protein